MAQPSLVTFRHLHLSFLCILLVQHDRLHFMSKDLTYDTLNTGSNIQVELIFVKPSRSTGSEHTDIDPELHPSLDLVAKVIILG
jgi:hypothetical protein